MLKDLMKVNSNRDYATDSTFLQAWAYVNSFLFYLHVIT